ncbi:pyridoxamine 5'-phosphate oxidase family protein [Aeromicrobium endophyticum]|nr:pyridoxamine 5'-phosphate oxidase family protein [Aeromicrobium endophyticum]
MNAFFSDGAARLDEAECLELLDTASVGRMAFVIEGRQHLLPINYVVHDSVVHVRTADGTSFSKLAQGTDVVFEVDYHDDVFRWGWSVTVHGAIRRVDDPAVLAHLQTIRRPQAWAAGERTIVLAVEPDEIAGRRVRLRD